MKTCACCKKEKSFAEYSTRCFPCQREYAKNHYQANKAEYITRNHKRRRERYNENILYIEEYLSTHFCVDCGEPDPIVLEFDHRKDKEFTIGAYHREVTLERLKKEIAKCDVRCANCHVRKTCKDFNWKRRLWKTKIS